MINELENGRKSQTKLALVVDCIKSRSTVGSVTLPFVAAVFAGVSFVLLFLDTSRYVAAKGAAQRAADRAARCIAVTDGGCEIVEMPTPPPARTWWGFPAVEEAEVFAQRGEYSAEIQQTNWNVSLARYSQRSELRSIGWEEYSLPVTRIVGLLNSWALLKARVEVRIRPVGAGPVESCILERQREIPWGLPFDSPSVYFDARWCGESPEAALAEAVSSSSCSSLLGTGPFELAVEPNWGSYCSLKLPGVKIENGKVVSANTQPWLLLGGEPVCDDQVKAPNSADLSRPLPSVAPGVAQVGTRNRPFPLTTERQYLVIDLVSCESEASLIQKLNAILPSTASPEQLAEFFGAKRELHGVEFDPYEFSALTPEELGTYSLFLARDSSPIALPDAYSWTYLRWERQVEKKDELSGQNLAVADPAAERTVLSRRVCGWRILDEATHQGLTGLQSVYPGPAPIRISYNDGSCQRLAARQSDARFQCANRFQSPILDSNFSRCVGWEQKSSEIQRGFVAENQRLLTTNSALPGNVTLTDSTLSFPPKLKAAWLPGNTDISWEVVLGNPTLEVGEYQQVLEPLRATVVSPNYRDGSPRKPTNAALLGIFAEQGASNVAGWSTNLSSAALSLTLGESSVARFEGLNPYSTVIGGKAFPVALQQEGGPAKYDVNLDCQSEPGCAADAVDDLESRLYELISSRYPGALPGLNDVAFSYKEMNTSLYYSLGNFAVHELGALAAALPSCAAVQTSCRRTRQANAAPILAGKGVGLPVACRSGHLVDCFAQTDFAKDSPRAPILTTDTEKARSLGFASVREVFPTASLAATCQIADCATIAIQRSEKHVDARVEFTLPLRFPLSTMLQREYLTVDGHAIEPLEVAIAADRR